MLRHSQVPLAVAKSKCAGSVAAIVAGILLSAPALAAEGTSFAPKMDFAAGAGANFVAVADINLDGKVDLVVTNAAAGSVSVLLGNGDGTYGAPLHRSTGPQPQSVAVGDLDLDGNPDLVVSNHSSQTLSLLFGDGTGAFGPKTDLTTALVGNGPRQVAIGDLNRDGLPDLAVASDNVENPGVVSVFLGTGGGVFPGRADFPTGKSSRGLVIADMNGDSNPDIVTANAGGSAGAGTVSILLGSGTGSFSAPASTPTGSSSIGVAAADFDRNLTLDLAVINSGADDVAVLPGDGTGLLGVVARFTVGFNPASVSSGDLNGDGLLDLAVANPDLGQVSVLIGGGSASFAPRAPYPTGAGPFSVALGDLNGDGRLDLVTANSVGTVSVLLNDGQVAPLWSRKLPSRNPPGRYAHAMAYDASRQEVVMFGGYDGSVTLADTWVWDGVNWTERTPATATPARSSHVMAYDAARQQVVMFGGAAGGGIGNDTWLWNGTDWTQVFPARRPPSRLHAAMTYDAARQKVVLFGGGPGSGDAYTDTWLWDGSDWTEVTPPLSPEPTCCFSMAYDEARQEVVLYRTTQNGGGFTAETWIWNGVTWTPRSTLTPPTNPRFHYRTAYHASRGKTILFGGQGPNNNPLYDDTWAWDGTSWMRQPSAPRPAGRTLAAMAYDSARSQIVLFGGFTGSFDSETWVWGTGSVRWVRDREHTDGELRHGFDGLEVGVHVEGEGLSGASVQATVYRIDNCPGVLDFSRVLPEGCLAPSTQESPNPVTIVLEVREDGTLYGTGEWTPPEDRSISFSTPRQYVFQIPAPTAEGQAPRTQTSGMLRAYSEPWLRADDGNDRWEDGDTRTPLILVHGIWSDATRWNDFVDFGTHVKPDGSNLNLASTFNRRFKIYRFQYPTHPSYPLPDPVGDAFRSQVLTDIYSVGEVLAQRIEQLELPQERVVFVGHSQGGLVARSYMQQQPRGGEARGLFTLGTPHRGAVQLPYLNVPYGEEIFGLSQWLRCLNGDFQQCDPVSDPPATTPSRLRLLASAPSAFARTTTYASRTFGDEYGDGVVAPYAAEFSNTNRLFLPAATLANALLCPGPLTTIPEILVQTGAGLCCSHKALGDPEKCYLQSPAGVRSPPDDPLDLAHILAVDLLNLVGPTLSIENATIAEGNSGLKNLEFKVTRSGGTDAMSFTFLTQNGSATADSDYTVTFGAASIAAGGDGIAVITVPIRGDLVNEHDETLTMRISNAQYGSISQDTGVGTILNDDSVTLSIGNVTVNPEGNDPMVQTPMTFTVTRTGQTALPVTFSYQTMDGTALSGSDYVVVPLTAGMIPAGGLSATTTITVYEVGDTVNEGNESFSVVLSNVQGATVAGTGIGTGSITDDDLTPPGLRVEDLVQAEGDAGGTVWNFPVNLSAPSGKTVTVRCRTEDQTALAGSDYTAVAAVDLVFAPGETSKLCPVTVSGDTLFESNETFRVLLSGVPGVPVNAGWQKQVAVGTITNDDASALTVSIDSQMVTEGNSGTSDMTFTVSLSAASGTTVSVRASTVAGTALAGYANDYVNRSNVLVSFLPGETSKTFTVQIVGNTVAEPTETFSVVLSSPSAGLTIGTGTGVGTILDND